MWSRSNPSALTVNALSMNVQDTRSLETECPKRVSLRCWSDVFPARSEGFVRM
jgi:hypothetical protein